MVQNFRKHFGPEMGYITTGLNLHQTVTLASIVETEAKLPQERPLVASVYLNRLNLHMLLGADPTVIYALKLANRWDGNIHKADLQIDSPYNTYRFPGLPPGPIANAGMASLQWPPPWRKQPSCTSSRATTDPRSRPTSRSTTATSSCIRSSGSAIRGRTGEFDCTEVRAAGRYTFHTNRTPE
jgi:hypothetical protein